MMSRIRLYEYLGEEHFSHNELKGKGPEGGKELYWKKSKKGRVCKGVCTKKLGPRDKHGLDNIQLCCCFLRNLDCLVSF